VDGAGDGRRVEGPGGAELLTLPKVELHVHLGGSVTEETARTLVRRHGLDPAVALPFEGGRYPTAYDGFPAFLRTLIAVNGLIRTPADLELVAAAFARGQAAQGVVYSEVIVTALSHVRAGVTPRDLWAALRAGFAAAPEARISIIVDAIRDAGPEELRETIRIIEDADAPIVGLGLTGIEGTWPVEDFAFIRPEADRLGFGIEVHAGEMGPPESVAASLDILGADRIGHGVAVVRDPTLLARVVRDRVPLDVCPTSNVRIGLYPSLADHPVRELWEAGATITISSDHPPYFGVTLVDELQRTAAVVGWSVADLVELQRRAARVSFLPAVDPAAWEERVAGPGD
jgi:aminodeoxyfutalosine deaminase